MKIDPYCQRQNNCSLPNVLIGGVYITLTSQGVPLLGSVK